MLFVTRYAYDVQSKVSRIVGTSANHFTYRKKMDGNKKTQKCGRSVAHAT